MGDLGQTIQLSSRLFYAVCKECPKIAFVFKDKFPNLYVDHSLPDFIYFLKLL